MITNIFLLSFCFALVPLVAGEEFVWEFGKSLVESVSTTTTDGDITHSVAIPIPLLKGAKACPDAFVQVEVENAHGDRPKVSLKDGMVIIYYKPEQKADSSYTVLAQSNDC